jgi:hypothetical protein
MGILVEICAASATPSCRSAARRSARVRRAGARRGGGFGLSALYPRRRVRAALPARARRLGPGRGGAREHPPAADRPAREARGARRPRAAARRLPRAGAGPRDLGRPAARAGAAAGAAAGLRGRHRGRARGRFEPPVRARPGWQMAPDAAGAWALGPVARERVADWLGVVLLVLARTHDAGLAGAIVAAATLPTLVSAPLIGAWLDTTAQTARGARRQRGRADRVPGRAARARRPRPGDRRAAHRRPGGARPAARQRGLLEPHAGARARPGAACRARTRSSR